MSELNDNNNFDNCIFNVTKATTLNPIIVDDNINEKSNNDIYITKKTKNVSKTIIKKKTVKKVRCIICRKKLNIVTKFTCPDCLVITCSTHRYSNEHSCCKEEDRYKKKRKILYDSLPEIIPDKLSKI